ncbi:Tar ligand binding domain-containing protein [Paralcaligenes sp. KSB-10]|uniref:Tar ligand binding domain-containing protein n=1 Tax=Paralcaligenes sp. KSB-10 TaxID=2901142 RepID=UPI001E2DF818|nr:Tar ligand binding domain-containing protein [Paralcaligenes sp. KSB-10]UHL65326.1 Tar ligand binding domain-containing protein [Paralcaligenes sp. KSB-10]
MRALSLLSNLKIRTSLILVLAFFLFMVFTGAVLGVFSMHGNNRALTQVAQNQRAGALIGEAGSVLKFSGGEVIEAGSSGALSHEGRSPALVHSFPSLAGQA